MDLFDYADAIELEKKADEVRIPEVGDRVEIPSIGVTGVISYIDHKHLYVDYFFPIQVELDFDHDNQCMWRTNLKDLIVLE
jgi:hypothetical protein